MVTKKNEKFFFKNEERELRFCKFKKFRIGSFTNVKEWKVEYEREVGNKFNDSGIKFFFFFFFNGVWNESKQVKTSFLSGKLKINQARIKTNYFWWKRGETTMKQ